MNDLTFDLESVFTSMYADDTTFYLNGPDTASIQDAIQSDMNIINDWYINNKMILNVDKSNTMVVCNSQKRRRHQYHLNVKIGGQYLQHVTNTEILGVTIDHDLKWSIHVDNMCKKLARLLALLRRICFYLTTESMVLFYNSYVMPCFTYCTNVWGNCNKTDLNRLFMYQKRFIRIVFNDYTTEVNDLFYRSKWLTVFEIIEYQTSILMFKCINGIAPDYLKQLFSFNKYNVYNLRRSIFDVIVPRPKTETLKRAFSYNGAATWNKIPTSVREAPNILTFKRNVKFFILSKRSLE